LSDPVLVMARDHALRRARITHTPAASVSSPTNPSRGKGLAVAGRLDVVLEASVVVAWLSAGAGSCVCDCDCASVVDCCCCCEYESCADAIEAANRDSAANSANRPRLIAGFLS